MIFFPNFGQIIHCTFQTLKRPFCTSSYNAPGTAPEHIRQGKNGPGRGHAESRTTRQHDSNTDSDSGPRDSDRGAPDPRTPQGKQRNKRHRAPRLISGRTADSDSNNRQQQQTGRARVISGPPSRADPVTPAGMISGEGAPSDLRTA